MRDTFFSAIIKADDVTRGLVKSKHLRLASEEEIAIAFPQPEANNPSTPPLDAFQITSLLDLLSDDDDD